MQFLDTVTVCLNHQKSSSFALAYHIALLLFIFFTFQMYMIENEASELRETLFLYRHYNLFIYFLFYFIFF